MAFGGLAQRLLVVADGLGDALQRGMQLHRLRIPPVDDVPEAGRRHASPHRRRHAGHPADERLQHRADLLVAGVDLACDGGHEIEVGVERSACGCRHRGSFRVCRAVYEDSTRARPIRFHRRAKISEHRVADRIAWSQARAPGIRVRRALAADGDAHVAVDQHRPLDVVVRADLAIGHAGLSARRSAALKSTKTPIGLLVERGAQRLRRRCRRLVRRRPRTA